MYGSSFCIVTRRPRSFSSRPSELAVEALAERAGHPSGHEDVLRHGVGPPSDDSFERVHDGIITIPRRRRTRGSRADQARAGPRRAAPWRARARPRRSTRTASGPARRPARSPSSGDHRGERLARRVRPSSRPPGSRANAATCGRWVTTSTWWSAPSAASASPTATAAVPPIPASTSSNTSVPAVGAGEHEAQRQHRPRQLAARRHPAERQQRRTRVGGEQELDVVAGMVVGRLADLDGDRGVAHRQLPQPLPRPRRPDAVPPRGGARRPPRGLVARAATACSRWRSSSAAR